MSEDTAKNDEVEIPPAEDKPENSASNWFSQGSAWGASFLNSAKEKTMTTLDLVKKDLNDLGEAVSSEMNDLASAAKEGFGTAVTAAKQQAQILEKLVTPTEEQKDLPGEVEIEKNEKPASSSSALPSSISFGWMSKIVDSVTDTVKNLAMEETTHEEDNFTERIQPKQIRKTNISQVKLTQIQTSESTYLSEPESSEFRERWTSRFNLDEYDGEINILLANNPALRQMFGKLVPEKVTYDQFWSRYFFAIEYADIEEEMNKSTLSEQLEVDVTTSKKNKKNKKNNKKQEDSSPSSEGSAVIVNEPTSPSQSEWSVCSEKNVEELPSNDEEDHSGPLTPKQKDDKKREDGWVNWDE